MLRFTTALPLVLFVLLTDVGQLAGADQSYEELCQQGRLLVDKGDYRQAVAVYSDAIQLDSAGLYAYVGRAVAYMAGRQYEDAANDCSKAMELAPARSVPVLLRGDARRGMGELELAITDYTAAIELDESCQDAYSKRAEIYLEQQDYDRALRDYSKALDLRADSSAALLGRAQAYCGRGDYNRAVVDYTAAIALSPETAHPYFLRAQANFDREAHDRVIADCTEAIHLDSGFAAAFGLRAAAYLANKDYDRATADLDEAIRLAPMDAGAFLWRGRAKAGKGLFQQAIADYTEAVRIDPKYAAAYEARASAYEKTGQAAEAKADKLMVNNLAASLKAENIDQPAVRSSQETPGWDADIPSSLSTLDRDVPSKSLLTDAVQGEAQQERTKAYRLKEQLEVCEARPMVPKPCDEADEVFDRSVALLDSGKYEVAAAGFRSAQKRYDEAFDAFEAVASTTSGVWLNWARERADRDTPKDDRLVVWLAIAEASHLVGDDEGYRAAMERAVNATKVQALTDPAEGVFRLLSIADIQYRCEDRAGMKNTILLAVSFCEGVQNAGRKAYRLARCTGMFGRLGDAQEWDKHMRLVLQAVEEVDRRQKDTRVSRTQFLTCIAYAEALVPGEAFKYALTLDTTVRKDYHHYEWTADAFAAVALAAARMKDSEGIPAKQFDEAYITACADLACFLGDPDDATSSVRSVLALADAEIGANDRAFANMASIPNPHKRAAILMEMVRASARNGDFDATSKWYDHIPKDAGPTAASFWLAMAKAYQGGNTMAQLKEWAEQNVGAARVIVSLAGIGAAVGSESTEATAQVGSVPGSDDAVISPEPELKMSQASEDQGKHLDASQAFAAILRENRADARVREMFDKSAAMVPEWWAEQAKSLAQQIDDPCDRAHVMLQLVRMNAEIDDEAAFNAASSECLACMTHIWARILERRSPGRLDYEGEYYWPNLYLTAKEEVAEINTMLGVLLDLEAFQRDVGNERMSQECLFLAIVCAEALPRNHDYWLTPNLDTLASWFARIAGRMSLSNHPRLSEIIVKDQPWYNANLADQDVSFLVGLSATEAKNVAAIQKLAEIQRKRLVSGHSQTCNTYAAILYGILSRIAAESGDESLYLKSAMNVGGLVNLTRDAAPRSTLAPVAEATAMFGQVESARDYLEQSGVRGAKHNRVLAAMVKKLLEDGDVVGARKTLKEIYDPACAVPAWYEMTKSEASAPSARLSAVYEEIEELNSPAKRAAALAGVAAALLSK